MVAVIDTNCDPDMVDYKVPGNDDAIRAIRLFCAAVADAVTEGKTIFEQTGAAQEKEEPTEQAPAPEPAPVAQEVEATEVPVVGESQ